MPNSTAIVSPALVQELVDRISTAGDPGLVIADTATWVVECGYPIFFDQLVILHYLARTSAGIRVHEAAERMVTDYQKTVQRYAQEDATETAVA